MRQSRPVRSQPLEGSGKSLNLQRYRGALEECSWLFFVNGCWLLWLSIVSFADSSAAGKQPAEYPDPGLIQVVDKNGRFLLGRAPLGDGSGLAPADATPWERGYEASLTPQSRG